MSKIWRYLEFKRDKNLPVLFLDIDGVLNCREDMQIKRQLCQYKVCLLNDLVPCQIVISSTWRMQMYQELLPALHWMGLTKEIVGRTTGKFKTRGEQVQHWLDHHSKPPFAIVDDDPDFLPHHERFFVKTDFARGLQHEHVAALNRILRRGHSL